MRCSGPRAAARRRCSTSSRGCSRRREGRVLFDGRDVTHLPPDRRNIAQVFQFPVIYDTMTVYQNLAFPAAQPRRRRRPHRRPRPRDRRMLELDDMLDRRASGLTPDDKQKISMGRGLVREDVNVIMFDEPLTVIDPHLKWKLRSKLKELHQRVARYDDLRHPRPDRGADLRRPVVVMRGGRGRADRHAGRPVRAAAAHLCRPLHRLAGHERPALRGPRRRRLVPRHRRRACDGPVVEGGRLEIGVRPEFVRLAAEARMASCRSRSARSPMSAAIASSRAGPASTASTSSPRTTDAVPAGAGAPARSTRP